MTTEDKRKQAAADRLLRLDAVEASISEFKRAVGHSPEGSLARQREAGRGLGYRILTWAFQKR